MPEQKVDMTLGWLGASTQPETWLEAGILDVWRWTRKWSCKTKALVIKCLMQVDDIWYIYKYDECIADYSDPCLQLKGTSHKLIARNSPDNFKQRVVWHSHLYPRECLQCMAQTISKYKDPKVIQNWLNIIYILIYAKLATATIHIYKIIISRFISNYAKYI